MRTSVIYPNFYRSFAQPAMLALARAGNRGCLIDVPLRQTFIDEAVGNADSAQTALDEARGETLNVNSPKQCHTLLYDDLQMPRQYKHRGGKKTVTADDEAVKKLRRMYPAHAGILTGILDIRKHLKRASMLGAVLEEREEGMVFPTSYNAAGTCTGRISSSKTLLGFGGNLQNQERGETRRIFRARPGMVFVKADGSQAEARVVAALCRDEELLAKFQDPSFDMHLENAQLIYGGTLEELRAEHKSRKAFGDSKRQKTKGVTHGAGYRGGPRVAAKAADIPFAEAKMAIAAYRRKRPLLQDWWDRVDQQVLQHRCIRTVWGRLRFFFKRLDESTFREATAHEPQSTIGDLINHAFFRLDKILAQCGAYPLLQAHDEIVCECYPNAVEAVALALKAELEFPLPFPTGPLIIPAEVSVGPNWGELEAWDG